MLVLSRKHGEQIELSLNGELVTVAVVRIASGRVQIGIDAPIHIGVRRKELFSPLPAGREIRKRARLAK